MPATRTPVTAERARDALLSVLPGLSRQAATLLLALVWVETGRGNVINNNPGNFSAGASWSGEAWRPPWYLDTSHPQHARMLAGQAPSAFRSYPTLAAGFEDFAVGLVRTFPTVLAAAATGDPAAFVRALHDSGYSRDYTAAHIGTFSALQHELAPIVASLPASSSAVGGLGLALGALLLLVAIKRQKGRRK